MSEFVADKPFKTYKEQMEILRKRNVLIDNEEFAKSKLSEISYYDLINGYKYLYESDDNDVFLYPISFYDFYHLYTFDTNLNNIIFKYIILIEKSLKTKLSYLISKEYGVITDLLDDTNMNENDYLAKKNYQNCSQRQSVLKDIKKEVNSKKRKELSIKHYLNNHNHLPCWVLIKGIPFGLTIKWYEILQPLDKEYICESFLKDYSYSMEDKKEFFKISLKILKNYRNNIAHGHKVFEKAIREQLPKKLAIELSYKQITNNEYAKGIGRNDIFAVIIIICTLVDKNTKIVFLNEIINTFNAYGEYTFSNGKSLLNTLTLPDDFISRLEKLFS